MVPQLWNGHAIRAATGTVERLRGDVVLHHDARIQGREIEFVEAFVHPDFRFEREAAAVAPWRFPASLESSGRFLFHPTKQPSWFAWVTFIAGDGVAGRSSAWSCRGHVRRRGRS